MARVRETPLNIYEHKFQCTIWHCIWMMFLVIRDKYCQIVTNAFRRDEEDDLSTLPCTSSDCDHVPVRKSLEYWKSVPLQRVNMIYSYPSNIVTRFVIFGSFFSSLVVYGAWRNLRLPATARKLLLTDLRHRLKFIRQSVAASSILHENFPRISQFLYSLESASDTELLEMHDFMCKERLEQPLTWFFEQAHCRYRTNVSDPLTYEASLSLTCLFYRDGLTGLERYTMLYRKWRYTNLMSALFVTLFATVERCIDLNASKLVSIKDLREFDYRGTEFAFDTIMKRSFMRFYPSGMDRKSLWFKDCMLFSVAYNCCNDLILFDWPQEKMERTIWMLEVGKHHVSERTYGMLQRSVGKPGLDLTLFKATTLLAFSISGLFCFHGRNENFYNHTSDPTTKSHLYGYLPSVTVQDLLDLGLLRKIKKNVFRMDDIPGISTRFKCVPVGDKLLLTHCNENTSFCANTSQQVI